MSVPDWSTVVHSCTDLLVLLQLRVVDPSDLAEFGSVVRVLDGVISSHSHCCCCRSNRRCPAPFLRSGHALCQQHVIQTHELRIRRVFILTATDTETWHNTANVNRDNRQRLFGYFQVRLLLNITVWKGSGSQHLKWINTFNQSCPKTKTIPVLWLIASKINVFVYIICVCTVYTYYVYINTHMHVYI